MQPTRKLADGLRRYPQKVSRPVSYRLLISYNDFRRASQIARYILKHRLQAKVDRLRGERRYRVMLLWQALNCAMVVAYCRPFSGNDRRTARRIPDLPRRFLATLTSEEREIPELALRDRNTLLAHSDSEAWALQPFFMEGTSGRKILIPSHHDARAPLIHEIVERLDAMCGKLIEAVFQERKLLEPDLESVLPAGPPSEILADDAAPAAANHAVQWTGGA